MLATLKSSYDVIVIDSGPLIPAVEARIFASCADHVIIVAAWRSTPIQILKRAIKLLKADARKLDGIVLNRVPAASMPYQPGLLPNLPMPFPSRQMPLDRAA